MQSQVVVIMAAIPERRQALRMLIEAAGFLPLVLAEDEEVMQACRANPAAALVVDLCEQHRRASDLLRCIAIEEATSNLAIIVIGRLVTADVTRRGCVTEVPGDPLDGGELLRALFDRLSGGGDSPAEDPRILPRTR